MKKIISLLLLITLIIGSISFIYANDINDDYRNVNWLDMYEINEHKPTAGFRIVGENDEVSAYTGYTLGNPNVLTVKLGETISIIDESIPNGSSIISYDFQVYCGSNSSKSVIKEYSSLPTSWEMTEEGTWNFYLCVRDNTTIPGGWHNWSDNGSHRSKGKPVPGFPDGLFWYFVHIKVEVVTAMKPVADMAFDDTSSTIKYITVGDSVTLVDKSYTIDDSYVTGWWIMDRGSPLTKITNPNSFFKTYTFTTAGTYRFELRKVISNENKESDNGGKALTVVVNPTPEPGQGDVIYEYYKDSVIPSNLLGTDELGISNPHIVILPSTYEGLKFSSATYSGEAVLTGGSCKSGNSITIDNISKNLLIQAIYKKIDDGGHMADVVAILGLPETAMAGDKVRADGNKSEPRNYIESYIFDYEGANLASNHNSYLNIWYPSVGEYEVYLDVIDYDGNTDWDYKEIKITTPIPKAVIKHSGLYKENRKITIDSTDSVSPDYYPIDKSKIKWEITSVSGGATNDIKYIGSLNGNEIKDILFKKAGKYKIKLTVTNTYGKTDSTETTITINPDLPPIADIFVMTHPTYRNPDDDNYATMKVHNESISPDGDTINKAVLMYCYDSNNDGNYKDEVWRYSIDGTSWQEVGMNYEDIVSNFNIFNKANSNVQEWILKTKEVGKYYFAIRVMEDIPPEETIPEFITENDYKRADNFN